MSIWKAAELTKRHLGHLTCSVLQKYETLFEESRHRLWASSTRDSIIGPAMWLIGAYKVQ